MKGMSFLSSCKYYNTLIATGICFLGLAFISSSAQTQNSGVEIATSVPDSIKRDPFWPVGYVPEHIQRAAELKESEQKIEGPKTDGNWNEAMKQVVINGVSSRAGTEAVAIINGQVKAVGDTVVVNHQSKVYTWAVDSITPPDSVKLRRVSAK